MKKLITISIAVLVLLAAFVSGVIVTNHQHKKHLKLSWFANLEFADQQANHAYFNESPAVAMWAIKQNIRRHEQAGHRGAHDILGTDTPLFLTISHARIAELYRQVENEAGFTKHVAIALSYSKQKNPNTSQNDLLESVTKFDEIEKQSYKRKESQHIGAP
jgi:hypothetical protein